MKKIILLFVLFILILINSFSSLAVSTPHIVISGEVWLLSEDDSKLFLLPNSYYAKINNLNDTYYYITFNGINGKVSKNTVSSLGYHGTPPSSKIDIKIADSFGEFESISIKATPEISSATVVSMPTSSVFSFIGEFPIDGQLWYYVKFEQYLGYVRADRTNAPKIDIPTFTPEADTPATTDQGDKKPSLIDKIGGNAGSLRIVIIIGLAIPAVLIIFLLFKPQKSSKDRYYD